MLLIQLQLSTLGQMQAQYTEFVADADAVLGRASSLSNGMVACSNIDAETTVGDTRILLYTGTTNANYTNGHWYYNSAASNAAPSWTDGGAVGSAPTIDNTLTVEGAAANSKAVGDAIENIVTISNTQPGSNSGNKVWIKETTSEEVQIPTYAEHIAKANKADIATNNESDNGSGTISASKAYAIGDHFYINNTNTSSENYGVSTLYKATAAIASGDAIVVGTNCEASKVADEITSLSNDIRNNEEKIDENVLKYNMRHKRNIIDDVRYGSSSSKVSVDENGIINIHVDGTNVNIASNTYYNLYFDTINGLFELGKTYYFTTGCLTKITILIFTLEMILLLILFHFNQIRYSYFTIPNNPEITKCIIRLHVKAGIYPDGVDEYCYPIITECDNIFDNKNDYSIKSIESYKDGSNNIDLNNIISSGSYMITSDINYTNYPNDENYDNTAVSILDVKSFFYSKNYVYILQTIRKLNRNSFSNDIYFERLLTLSITIKDATPSIYTDWKGFNIPENSSSLKQERYMFRAVDPQSDLEKYPEAIHGTYNSSGNIKPRTDKYWAITYERLCDNSRFMHGSGVGNTTYYFLDEDKKVLSTNSFSTIPERAKL